MPAEAAVQNFQAEVLKEDSFVNGFSLSQMFTKILLSICCWLNVDLKWTFILAQFNVQILNFV